MNRANMPPIPSFRFNRPQEPPQLATSRTPELPSYFVGLDLGQAMDYSAIAVLERRQIRDAKRPERQRWNFACRYLHRWELGTRYPAIVEDVNTLLSREPLTGCTLAVDRTGVGAAVRDMLVARELPCQLRTILITSGHAVSYDKEGIHLPKRELAGIMMSIIQSRRLQIVKSLALAAVLEKELETFKVKVTLAGNETFESWRERDHDDIVLAIAMAAWLGEREPQMPPMEMDYDLPPQFGGGAHGNRTW